MVSWRQKEILYLTLTICNIPVVADRRSMTHDDLPCMDVHRQENNKYRKYSVQVVSVGVIGRKQGKCRTKRLYKDTSISPGSMLVSGISDTCRLP